MSINISTLDLSRFKDAADMMKQTGLSAPACLDLLNKKIDEILTKK